MIRRPPSQQAQPSTPQAAQQAALPPIARSRSRNLSETVVEELGSRIRGGPLRAGDKLPTEAAIMDEFGVSRTVVREAISRLQAAGMVQTRQGIGTFVVAVASTKPFQVESHPHDSLAQSLALLELRVALESEAAALAARRRLERDLRSMAAALDDFDRALVEGIDTAPADFQFHLLVARASHSLHFAAVLEALGPSSVPPQLLESSAGAAQRAAWTAHVQREHRSILSAIRERDGDAARAAMRTHLVNGRERRRAAERSRL